MLRLERLQGPDLRLLGWSEALPLPLPPTRSLARPTLPSLATPYSSILNPGRLGRGSSCLTAVVEVVAHCALVDVPGRQQRQRGVARLGRQEVGKALHLVQQVAVGQRHCLQ